MYKMEEVNFKNMTPTEFFNYTFGGFVMPENGLNLQLPTRLILSEDEIKTLKKEMDDLYLQSELGVKPTLMQTIFIQILNSSH